MFLGEISNPTMATIKNIVNILWEWFSVVLSVSHDSLL